MPLPPLVEPVAALSDREAARTARHATLAGFGELAQRRLAAAHVAVVGAGGLGSPVILALAAAGVGTLSVIDDDDVDASNLQRQVMHRLSDVGAPKTASAARVAADLSPDTVVHEIRERLTADNATRLLAGADLVIDGTDTFGTRVDVAEACATLGVPLVWGVVQEFHAQVTVFWSDPPAGAEPVLLSDLYPADSVGELPTCAAVGVLGALVTQVGGMLAIEAIKLIAGIGEPLLGRVVVIDALRGTQREVPLRAAAAGSSPAAAFQPATAAPSAHATPAAAATRPSPAAAPTRPASPARPTPPVIAQVTADEMLAAQDAGAIVLDVREPWETQTGIVGGSTLVPLGAFLADPDQIIDDPSVPVVVVCAHGIRAQQAAEVLSARGVEASVLAGGLAAWTGA